MQNKSKLIPIILMLILSFMNAWSEDIRWMDYNTAVAQAKKENKFVFVDLYAEWCGPCKVMAQLTYKDAKVVDLINKNFLATKMDVESEELIQCENWPRKTNTCVTQYWKLYGVPVVMIVGPSGYNIMSIMQFLGPDEMVDFLGSMVENKEMLFEADKKVKESHSAVD